MLFSPEELAIINIAIQLDTSNQVRLFPLGEQITAIDAFKKVRKFVNENSDEFESGEIEFSTAEKSLLIKCLERSWSVASIDTVLKIKEKLQ